MTALAHPQLLWTGLALVAVPILIHLFFRRRHRVVRWAAMTFLLAALKKQKRRIEVENLLLLLVRCAVIALLALAIARPAVQAASLDPFTGGARSLVLVVDTSGSMGARHTGRSALDRARERAGKLLADLPEGSRVTLVATRDDASGGGPRAVLENARPAEVRTRLATLRPGYGGHRLGETLRLVNRQVETMRGRRQVVFLTDLQRRDWVVTDLPPTGARDAAGGERRALGARHEDVHAALGMLGRGGAEEGVPVALVDVGQPDGANVLVETLTVDEGREAFAPSLLWLSASLVNYGASPADGTLSLYMAPAGEGRWEKKETHRVTVEPSVGIGVTSRTSVTLHQMLRAGSEGPARFKVVFEPASGTADRLEQDNQRFLTLRVRPPVRVLPVRSYTRALEILTDVDAATDVIEFLEPIYPSSLGQEDLSRVDVVLWADADVHLLDPEAVAALERFVRRGGGLLAYLGSYAHPARTNQLFFREKGEGLFPMLLVEEGMRIDDDHPVRIDVLAESTQAHPLFRDTSQASLFYSPDVVGYPRVRREFLEDEDFARSHIVARYADPEGNAAVLVHRLGRGRVVIVTTTPDERAMRQNGSLLPLVLFFNAAHYLVFEDPAERNVLVGEPVRLSLPPGARRVVVEPPEEAGGRTEEPVEDASRPFVLSDTAFPGFYRIRVQGVSTAGATSLPTEEVLLAAANADASEGDLRRVEPPELQRLYGRAAPRFVADTESELEQAGSEAEDELSRSLLLGVVLLLVAELVMAWRFGRRRRAVA